MRTKLAISLAAVAVALVAAAPSFARQSQVVGPWSGELPFNCNIQDVGTGTDFPHPNADPFCVEFDKRRQNVTGLGLADFLSKEPARVAAAVPKCFYYQRDHWTGSIVQGQSPELWHWDGEYFFDKARGLGGVSVHNFRIGGVPMNPAPYAPGPLKPYFHAGGGGGAMVLLKTRPDPTCAARIDTPKERRRVYRDWYRLLPR
ncbi:MAG: hypothetical protein ACRDK1_00885 [Solirubrobacterales bacterium]